MEMGGVWGKAVSGYKGTIMVDFLTVDAWTV